MKNKKLQLGIYTYFIVRGIYYFLFNNHNMSIIDLLCILMFSLLFLTILIQIKDRPIYKYILFPIFIFILIIGTSNLVSFILYQYLPKYSIFIIYGSILLLLIYIVKEQKIVFIRSIQIYFFISILIYILIFINLIYRVNIINLSLSLSDFNIRNIIWYSLILSIITRIYLLFFEKTDISKYKSTILSSYIFTFITIILEKIVQVSILTGNSLSNYKYSFIKVLENIHFYNLIDRFDKVFSFIYLLDGFILVFGSMFLIKDFIIQKRID